MLWLVKTNSNGGWFSVARKKEQNTITGETTCPSIVINLFFLFLQP
jgi:hypothetical protein